MWKVDALTAEEAHAAEDLALYTVNTGALYPMAKAVMQWIADLTERLGRKPKTVATGVADHRTYASWVGHAKRGLAAYEREIGYDDRTDLMRKDFVLREAARLIEDHYAEEQAETLPGKKTEGSD